MSDLARSPSCVVKEKDVKIKLYNLRLGGIIVDSWGVSSFALLYDDVAYKKQTATMIFKCLQ